MTKTLAELAPVGKGHSGRSGGAVPLSVVKKTFERKRLHSMIVKGSIPLAALS